MLILEYLLDGRTNQKTHQHGRMTLGIHLPGQINLNLN